MEGGFSCAQIEITVQCFSIFIKDRTAQIKYIFWGVKINAVCYCMLLFLLGSFSGKFIRKLAWDISSSQKQNKKIVILKIRLKLHVAGFAYQELLL